MPSAQYSIDDTAVVEVRTSFANRQFVSGHEVEHMRDVVGGNRAIGILVIDVLVIRSVDTARRSVPAAHAAASGVRERIDQHGGHVGGLDVGNLLGERVSRDEVKAAR